MRKIIKNKLLVMFIIFFFGTIVIDGVAERNNQIKVNQSNETSVLDY